MGYLTKYSILSWEQYGFRENLTTDNATYQLTYEILTAMNKSKAFDFVNHNILLLKMELYRIIGKELALCTQYPTDINEYT